MTRCACPPDGSAYCARCTALLQRATGRQEPVLRPLRQTSEMPATPLRTAQEPAGGTTRGSGPTTAAPIVEAVRGIPGPITLVLTPLRTVSPLNAMAARHARMRRSKRERKAAYEWLTHWLPTVPAVWPGCAVLLTRIAPRLLDDDNLQAALKHVRDGMADWWDSAYLHGDDRQPGLTWQYGQRKGKSKEYAVEITLTPQEEHNE